MVFPQGWFMGTKRLLERWAAYGILAPSHLNRQPWLLRDRSSSEEDKAENGPGGAALEISLDPKRLRDLREDPERREDHMALGAAVEYLLLSAPAMGYRADWRCSDGPTCLVRLRPQTDLSEPNPLFACMATRDEHGGFFNSEGLTDLHRDRLSLSVDDLKRPTFHLIEGDLAERFGTALRSAGRAAEEDPARLGEVAAWLRDDERSGDGIPHGHAGLSRWQHLKLLFRERFNPWEAHRDAAHRYLTLLGRRKAPGYMLLTGDRDAATLFEAGRAAARLLLVAEHLQRATQVQSALLNGSKLEASLMEAAGLSKRVPLLWVARVGIPGFRSWPRTPRRPLTSFWA
jgi:hypothetical protein